MLIKYTTESFNQTQKLGENYAKEILKINAKNNAVVFALQGDLGSGKTTFLQGFAKGLGIKEKILSPTFVIMKRFEIKNKDFNNFCHIDCYRIKDSKDILELDFKKIISDQKNIVAVEWPEKIRKILPKDIISIDFKFIDKNKREIKLPFYSTK